jgi:molybdenum cofactor biosynthesis protein B
VSHVEHRAEAPPSVRCFVLTVSDTRTEATDSGGRAIADLLTSHGHHVTARRIVRDEPVQVSAVVLEQLEESALDAIITTGGTGITSRDSTFEAVSSLLEKTLVGFGEIFRMLSYQEIGPAAMLSRATAGLAKGKIVIALPGSEHAVRLAMTKLILPELGHMVREARK